MFDVLHLAATKTFFSYCEELRFFAFNSENKIACIGKWITDSYVYSFVAYMSNKHALDCEVEERSWVNTCSIVSLAAVELGEKN